jgi:hypothetical protein
MLEGLVIQSLQYEVPSMQSCCQPTDKAVSSKYKYRVLTRCAAAQRSLETFLKGLINTLINKYLLFSLFRKVKLLLLLFKVVAFCLCLYF